MFYIDENNLYGNCMLKTQPNKNFKWLSEKACKQCITNDVLQNFDAEHDRGFLAEIDLEYLSDVLDLSLAPEAGTICEEQFSLYMQRVWTNYHESRPYDGTQSQLLTHQPKVLPLLPFLFPDICFAFVT